MLYTFMKNCDILCVQAPGKVDPGKHNHTFVQAGDFFLTAAIRGREEESGCLSFYCLFKANVLKGVFLWQKN